MRVRAFVGMDCVAKMRQNCVVSVELIVSFLALSIIASSAVESKNVFGALNYLLSKDRNDPLLRISVL